MKTSKKAKQVIRRIEDFGEHTYARALKAVTTALSDVKKKVTKTARKPKAKAKARARRTK